MGQVLWSVIKLAIFLPVVIALILWLGKIAEKYSNLGGRASSMKVIDRLPLSKDNGIFIVKIGEKFYIVTSSPGKVDIVREIEEGEIENLTTAPLKDITKDEEKIKFSNIKFPWKGKNI